MFRLALFLIVSVACSSAPKNRGAAPSANFPLGQRAPAAALTIERLPIMNFEEGKKAIVQTIQNEKQYLYEVCDVDFAAMKNGGALIEHLNSVNARCTPMQEGLFEVGDEKYNSMLEKAFQKNLDAGVNEIRPGKAKATKEGLYFVAAYGGAMTTALYLTSAKRTISRPTTLVMLGIGGAFGAASAYAGYKAWNYAMENPPVTVEHGLKQANQKPEYKSALRDITPREIFDVFEQALRKSAKAVLQLKYST